MTAPAGTFADRLVEAFAATLPFTLDEFQVEALHKLESHRGVLVSAPTSSGKTVVAEYAIFRALAEGVQVIYTTRVEPSGSGSIRVSFVRSMPAR